MLLLTRAAECWDRGEQARKAIARQGLTIKTQGGGRKLNPAVRVESDCRTGLARLLRELDLDIEAPRAGSRPPALRSIAGRRA